MPHLKPDMVFTIPEISTEHCDRQFVALTVPEPPSKHPIELTIYSMHHSEVYVVVTNVIVLEQLKQTFTLLFRQNG